MRRVTSIAGAVGLGFLSFGFLASVVLVLLTPLPRDPWRKAPVPEGGLYLRATDGADLFLRHWQPARDGQRVVLAIHGLGQHSGYHHRIGAMLAERGTIYYAVDLRGNGLTRTPHGDVPSVERLYDDLDELLIQMRQRHPGIPVFVLGHSLGGSLVASWAAERQPAILDGLVIIAPAATAEAADVPWVNWLVGPALWTLFPHRSVMSIADDAYAPERLSRTIDLPDEVTRIASDPLQLRGMSMAFALAAARLREQAARLAPRIAVPTLVLVGDQDPALAGARQLYEMLPNNGRSWTEISNGPHLLFHVQATPAVAEAIHTWLSNRS